MIFAMVLERSPVQWADVPGGIVTWVTVAGGFATLFLALWLLYYALGLGSSVAAQNKQASLFRVALVIALVGYAAGWAFTNLGNPPETHQGLQSIGTGCYLVGGGCALAAVLLPFAVDFMRL